MKTKLIKITTLAMAALCASAFTLAACKPPQDVVDEGEYSVVLNYNDNSSYPRTMYVEEGHAINSIAAPTQEGYQLSHWTIGSLDGATLELPYTPTGNVELFAHWQEAVYNVNFNWNIEDSEVEPTVVQVAYNHTVEAPSEDDYPTNSGNVLFGWNSRADGNGNEISFPYTVKRETSFYAQWVDADTRIYNISFDANYPDAEAIDTVVRIIEGNSLEVNQVPRLTRTGFAFVGWALGADANSNDIISLPFTPDPESESDDITLYAIWQEARYQVRFRSNLVYENNSSDIFARPNFAPGVEFAEPDFDDQIAEYLETMPGFEFDGWYDARIGGNKIEFPHTFTASSHQQVYAHWVYQNVETNQFDAEFTFIRPTLHSYGWSNEVDGVGIIQDDLSGNANASSADYPLLTDEKVTEGHRDKYVGYLFAPGLDITFEIYSDRETTATLTANLGSEIERDLVIYSADGQRSSYQISVNGSAIDYGSISFAGDPEVTVGAFPYATRFKEVTIGQISLREGLNTIVFRTNNSTAIGGTTRAIGPRIDWIKIVDTQATLSWRPEYGNVYRSQ